ncbi:MAG TPA: hypothetical protein VK809_00065 [Bacteroidia bacterium]|jgi:hypothetical protein|nr:hypothetical protein [Bacteroidia bacterium]
MAVYRFKVYFEDDESVIREIEIKSTQTFEDFHKIIQSAIGFDGAHPTSFYVSNDNWRRGKEIILLHKSHSNGLKGTWMHETKLAAYMDDPHQKFIYEFDPEGANWILQAELMKIIPEASVTYPRINKSIGAAPPQYKVTSPADIPVVEEEEIEAAIVDDAEDTYVHPEAVNEFEVAEEEDEVVPRRIVKEAAMEIPDEEAVEDASEEDPEMVDEEDESAEQQGEDYA